MGEGPTNPRNTILVSLSSGKGSAFVVSRRHPPTVNHLCNTGKCQGGLATQSRRALGTEAAQDTSRPHAGPRGHRSPERQRRRSLSPPTASRTASSGFPLTAGTTPGHRPEKWLHPRVRKWPAAGPGPLPSPPGPRAQRAETQPPLPSPARARGAPTQVPPGRSPAGAGSPGAHGRSRQGGPPTWPCPCRGSRLRVPAPGPPRSPPPSGLRALPDAHALRRRRCYFCFSRGRTPRDSSGAAPRAPARPTPGPRRALPGPPLRAAPRGGPGTRFQQRRNRGSGSGSEVTCKVEQKLPH